MRRGSIERQSLAGYLFATPAIAGLLLLVVYPFAASLYWSFCRYDMLSAPQLAGLENYEKLSQELLQGDRFGQAVWNTFYYAALSVPLSIALGITLAVLLRYPMRGRALFRTLFFLPTIVPVVAASVLWLWLLDPQDGLVNYGLQSIGLPPQNWFNGVSEAAWLPDWWQGTGGFGSKDALVLMGLWGVGNFMIIYLAALGDIPKSLYEAAELDGATPWRQFWHITLPLLTPVIFFNLVMGVIQSLQAFTQVYIVSEGQGAPAGSTLMLSLYLFLTAFKNLQMGYASAMAWVLFVLVLGATVLMFRTSRHWVYDARGGK